jgi:hypothetical protein
MCTSLTPAGFVYKCERVYERYPRIAHTVLRARGYVTHAHLVVAAGVCSYFECLHTDSCPTPRPLTPISGFY